MCVLRVLDMRRKAIVRDGNGAVCAGSEAGSELCVVCFVFTARRGRCVK